MRPLVVILGATASGKSALSLALAQRFGGEIVSCDSVAVYRHMELGTAKPSAVERALVRHHCLDLYDPDEACTAGDYARHARAALDRIEGLPVVSGGTGLYLRALVDGLFPGPPRDERLRERLRRRPSPHLHRLLGRIDPAAAALIHRNDQPKLIRAVEVSVAARRPITSQWTEGRDALTGFRILRLGLAPEREVLYARIDARAARMFSLGLVEETRGLIARYGEGCRAFTSLGYNEAGAVLRGELTEAEAIVRAQQGHRNYAKRQITWFRKEAEMHEVHWLRGVGDDPAIVQEAMAFVEEHLLA